MKFFVIGIDDNNSPHFSPQVLEVIQSHTLFSGGKRHYELVRHLLPANATWIAITVPLEHVFTQYQNHPEIVVFASGDPLFFGFANTIQRKMPQAEIVLFPYFNSLQLLAHRMLMPYQDMHIVSLTGRVWHKFDEALINGYSKIGVLTDNKTHTPAQIAKRMLDYGYDNYTLTVGELLGNKERERVTSLTLEEAADREFAFPNNLVLQKKSNRERPFGIPEGAFHLLNGRAKMITKMPIRLLSLSRLDLREKAVFWDIGFCTGSVSIEAKLQFPHLQIVAFEQREEGRELLECNSRKFGTPGILSYIGDFTQTDVTELPRPDAVFIGGHGGKMKEIVNKLSALLAPNGVIVFNSVSKESKELFVAAVQENKLTLEQSITLQVDDFNVIEIMKAKR